MTPKMNAALLAAYDTGNRGLEWTRAGWINPAKPTVHHNATVVSRLVYDRRFLEARGPKSGPKQRRVITTAGARYVHEELSR